MAGRYYDDWAIGDLTAYLIHGTVTEANDLLLSTMTAAATRCRSGKGDRVRSDPRRRYLRFRAPNMLSLVRWARLWLSLATTSRCTQDLLTTRCAPNARWLS